MNSNDAVMELLLIINSCRLASAESISVITPYFPYSKGDQKSSLRSPITAKLLANIRTVKFTENKIKTSPEVKEEMARRCESYTDIYLLGFHTISIAVVASHGAKILDAAVAKVVPQA